MTESELARLKFLAAAPKVYRRVRGSVRGSTGMRSPLHHVNAWGSPCRFYKSATLHGGGRGGPRRMTESELARLKLFAAPQGPNRGESLRGGSTATRSRVTI